MSYKKMATDHSRHGSSKSTMSNSLKTEELKNQDSFQKSFEECSDYDLSVSLLEIALHISGMVNTVNNGIFDGDKILSAFSNHLDSKCVYSFDSSGRLCFKFKDYSEKFIESLDSGLLAVLGIYACYTVNLVMMEEHNNALKGLNSYLLKNCPETYNAYIKLSKEFDFNTIVKLVDKNSKIEISLNNDSITNSDKN